MIRTDDLTEIDFKNLFHNREIESEVWKYGKVDGLVEDRYLFSSIGRCYDFTTKEFKKLYLNKGKGSIWYLRTIYDEKNDWQVSASDVLRQIFYEGNYGEDVRESLDDCMKAYCSRIELNNKVIQKYRDKIQEIKSEIELYEKMIIEEQHNKNSTIALLNAVKIATDKPFNNSPIKPIRYYGVKEYLNSIGVNLHHSEYVQIGKLVTKYCNSNQLKIKKVEDSSKYPIDALNKVWHEYKRKYD